VYTNRFAPVNRDFDDRACRNHKTVRFAGAAHHLQHRQSCLKGFKINWKARMLRSLYDWTMSLAARKSAEVWLAVIAFVESSVFLVPADVLYLPMALARPERAWRYALVATVASVLGGIAGWYIGHYAFETLARPILQFYGKLEAFEQLKASVGYETLVLLLSGAANINLGLFIISAIIARGARFFMLAWLLRRYGEEIRHFIEKRLGMLAAAVAGLLIAMFAAYRFLA
jgi:membrane protein YqaA with SNARE-associated domain